MRRLDVICLSALFFVAQLPPGFAYGGGGGSVYRGPMGGVGVRDREGGAGYRGPMSGGIVYGPSLNVYGGHYGSGMVAGAARGTTTAAYPPAYYEAPCGPPYTASCSH